MIHKPKDDGFIGFGVMNKAVQTIIDEENKSMENETPEDFGGNKLLVKDRTLELQVIGNKENTMTGDAATKGFEDAPGEPYVPPHLRRKMMAKRAVPPKLADNDDEEVLHFVLKAEPEAPKPGKVLPEEPMKPMKMEAADKGAPASNVEEKFREKPENKPTEHKPAGNMTNAMTAQGNNQPTNQRMLTGNTPLRLQLKVCSSGELHDSPASATMTNSLLDDGHDYLDFPMFSPIAASTPHGANAVNEIMTTPLPVGAHNSDVSAANAITPVHVRSRLSLDQDRGLPPTESHTRIQTQQPPNPSPDGQRLIAGPVDAYGFHGTSGPRASQSIDIRLHITVNNNGGISSVSHGGASIQQPPTLAIPPVGGVGMYQFIDLQYGVAALERMLDPEHPAYFSGIESDLARLEQQLASRGNSSLEEDSHES